MKYVLWVVAVPASCRLDRCCLQVQRMKLLRLFTKETCVLTVALGQISLPVLQFSPVSIIPPLLHTHSFIYHPHCIMFFSQYFSFSCQYHSTIAPYSFIHLPPILNNIFLPALQFPLSVSFHHCSMLIHSSTTHTV